MAVVAMVAMDCTNWFSAGEGHSRKEKSLKIPGLVKFIFLGLITYQHLAGTAVLKQVGAWLDAIEYLLTQSKGCGSPCWPDFDGQR